MYKNRILSTDRKFSEVPFLLSRVWENSKFCWISLITRLKCGNFQNYKSIIFIHTMTKKVPIYYVDLKSYFSCSFIYLSFKISVKHFVFIVSIIDHIMHIVFTLEPIQIPDTQKYFNKSYLVIKNYILTQPFLWQQIQQK